ncbi:DUF4251 domain-containing protein [Aquimarina sp. RZ0]|uniref:DUF4251 domain-containing protein n=1 Tax=Aquimarina sp. RZ0 TaxID=2607730 RepID=UPI001CB71DD3|nr:DUF4251 domain-containing protein [Aquimarina sp. RZ0]
MIILLIRCGSTHGINSTADTETNNIDLLIQEKKFMIISDWASPLATTSFNAIANSGLIPLGSNVNRINLIGNPNYLKVIGDSISLYLPYYGEQRFGIGYNNSDTGIKYDGIPDMYEVKKDKKGRQRITLNFKNKTESCRVLIVLFESGRSDMTINTSHRTQIGYTGTISKLEENSVATN